MRTNAILLSALLLFTGAAAGEEEKRNRSDLAAPQVIELESRNYSTG